MKIRIGELLTIKWERELVNWEEKSLLRCVIEFLIIP